MLSAAVFAGLIAVAAIVHLRFKLNAILAFWVVYILTRPLGASLGDYLSQAPDAGGLGLGTVVTSAIFMGTILLIFYAPPQVSNKSVPNATRNPRKMPHIAKSCLPMRRPTWSNSEMT